MKTRSVLPLPAAVFLLALAPALLLASGTRTGFKDADAIGRGNAFAATADNPAAIYYNPAGLTQLEGQSVLAGAYIVQLQSDFTNGGPTTHMKRETHPIPEIYYTYAPRGASYALGLGAFSPFGLSTEWAPTSGFRTVATRAEEKDLAVTAVAAWKITPELSIGGGPVFHKISARLSRDITPAGGDFTFDGDSTAISFNAGIRWQPSAQHAFGLTYHSHYSSDLTGTASFAPVPPFPLVVPASANFVFPEVVIAGWSCRPSPEWNFEVNVEWMNWNRVNSIVIRDAVPVPAIPLNWRSSCFYDFGVTRQLANGLHVSAGYTYAEDSTPDATYNPAVPDTNRHLLGLGLGGHAGGFDWQFAAQYGFAETRTVVGSPVIATLSADGTYRGRTYALALSLSRRF